ncbi:hypothetical protein [Dactylosporangium sp. NPDC049140]|uniref:hypothetical protein n=1 Tax=Dactylosporangium sp. NPDC049140 TaxID=3155647 RepID=UPI0033C6A212
MGLPDEPVFLRSNAIIEPLAHGLRLRAVHVRGRLDLAGVDIPFPLAFADCTFDEAPDLTDAGVRALALTGAPRLPGLLANGLRVRGDLDLSRSRIEGVHRTGESSAGAAVWLCDAEVGGRLLALDTVIDGGVFANRIHVGGNVRLAYGFTATGEIRLRGARVDGSFDLAGAHIAHPTSAVDLGEAHIGGSIFIVPNARTRRPPRIAGRITLSNATIAGRLSIRDAHLRAADDDYAVVGRRLSIGGPLKLAGECRVAGGIDLSYARFTTVTVEPAAELAAPGRDALNLTSAEGRSHLVLEPGVTVDGAISVAGAHLRGDLVLRGVTLRSPRSDGALVSGAGATIDGGVQLQGLRATGGFLGFRGARIGGSINAGGAVLVNPGERTLGLRQATVKGSVRLMDGFRSNGFVALNRSVIEGRLNLRGGSFQCPGPSDDNPAGHAIQTISTTVRSGVYLLWDHISPSVDFRGLATSVLDDDPDRWPERIIVSGMTYDRFGDLSFDRAARLRWLRRQSVYDAEPYEQLAEVFRRHGYRGDAEAILIERRHQARRAGRRHRLAPRSILDLLYGLLVGYGYRPGRTVWFLLALLVAVAASLYVPGVSATLRATDPRGNTYAVDGRLVTVDPADPPGPAADAAPSAGSPRPDPCGDGQVRCFNPVLYAIDTVVPLISLGQRTTWYPSPHARHGTLTEWWLNLATLAGWVLSSLYLLSFTRFARSA